MTDTMTFRDLTPDELDELKRYAEKNKRTWKRTLQDAWGRGLPVPGFPLLYGLRNSHGPEWLVSFSLTPAAPYYSEGERKTARKLVRTIRGRGYVIRHSDGEDVTDCAELTEAEIMALLSQTGQDILSVYKDGQRIGSFVLIGQGPDAEGDELVADYSWRAKDGQGDANEAAMNEMWKEVIKI